MIKTAVYLLCYLDDAMVGSITFYDFCSFWSMAVNTVDILQFLSFIIIKTNCQNATIENFAV